MKQRPLRPRDLVVDSYGAECIVMSRVGPPAKAWLQKQADVGVRRCGRSKWLAVVPLSGGSGVVPEPRARLLREATVDDVRAAVACAMPAGVTNLLELFPELARAPFILGRALIAKAPTRVWRHRLRRGDPSVLAADVRCAEMAIVSFVERVISWPDADTAREALRAAVGVLNGLVASGEKPGLKLDSEERNGLAGFLVEVAQTAGLPVSEGQDLIRRWRTW